MKREWIVRALIVISPELQITDQELRMLNSVLYFKRSDTFLAHFGMIAKVTELKYR